MIQNYLASVASANTGTMQYVQLWSLPQSGNSVDDSYDILIVACPTGTMSSSERSMLATWAQRWHRRIVLVGDCGYSWYVENGYLNTIAGAIGGFPQFQTAREYYDGGIDNTRLCSLNYSSCLARNVSYLRDASTGKFQTWGGWVSKTQSGYIWIADCPQSGGGDGVTIHDANLFDSTYNDSPQMTFVANLCTIFE